MGERWYGDKYLFGTQGSYSKIDQEITIPEYTNYTIFLEPNLLGTLTQQKIEANEFWQFCLRTIFTIYQFII